MKRMLRLGAAALAVAAAACAGYRSDPLFPEGMRRIAVPIFENETFFRQIEFDLTRQVANELRARPGIHVVDPAEADVILEGRIVDVDQRVLALARRERPLERSATTSVRCRVVERATGRVLKEFVERERVDFLSGAGEGLESAQTEAFHDLARKIVFQLEADW